MKDQTKLFFAQWGRFFMIVLNPWVIILAVPTFYLLLQSSQQTNPTISTILSLLAALSSGLLGGVIANKWSSLNDVQIVTTRGRAAVRSLKLLLINIASVDKRVQEYIARSQDAPFSQDLALVYLEEIIYKCQFLEEEVLNSIENWTDIVPEADIKTQIGIISELRAEVNQKEEEKHQLKTKLENTEATSSSEVAKLQSLIQEKDKELRDAKDELWKRRTSTFGLGSNSTSVLVGGGITSENFMGSSGGIFVDSGSRWEAVGSTPPGVIFDRGSPSRLEVFSGIDDERKRKIPDQFVTENEKHEKVDLSEEDVSINVEDEAEMKDKED